MLWNCSNCSLQNDSLECITCGSQRPDGPNSEDSSLSIQSTTQEESSKKQRVKKKESSIVKKWLERRKRKRKLRDHSIRQSGTIDATQGTNETTTTAASPSDSASPPFTSNIDENSLFQQAQDDNPGGTKPEFDYDTSIRHHQDDRTTPAAPERTNTQEDSHRTSPINLRQQSTPFEEPQSLESPLLLSSQSPRAQNDHEPSPLQSVESNESPQVVVGNFFYTQATQCSQESPPTRKRSLDSTPLFDAKRNKSTENAPICTEPPTTSRSCLVQTAVGGETGGLPGESSSKRAVHWKTADGCDTAGSQIEATKGRLQQTSSLCCPPMGFSTAGSGNGIVVDFNSMEQANALLNGESCHASALTCSGFLTAGSGSEVTVREDTLQRTGALFERGGDSAKRGLDFSGNFEGSQSNSWTKEVHEASFLQRTRSKGACSGFRMAGSGTEVTVTAETLQRAHSVLDLGGNAKIKSPFIDGNLKDGQCHYSSTGFSSGRVENAVATAEGVPKTGVLLETHSGFRMAGSGTELEVRTETLERALSLFDQGEEDSGKKDLFTPNFDCIKRQVCGGSAESAAGHGENMFAFEGDVQKARSLIESGSEIEMEAISSKTFNRGFCTAGSGTTVTVSEESIKQIGALFANNEAIQKQAENQDTGNRASVPRNDQTKAVKLRKFFFDCRNSISHRPDKLVDGSRDKESHEQKAFLAKESCEHSNYPFEVARMDHSSVERMEGLSSDAFFSGFRSAGQGKEVRVGKEHLQRVQGLVDGVGAASKEERVTSDPDKTWTDDVHLNGGLTFDAPLKVINGNDKGEMKLERCRVSVSGESLECTGQFSAEQEAEAASHQSVAARYDVNGCPAELTFDGRSETNNNTVFKTTGQGGNGEVLNTALDRSSCLFGDGYGTAVAQQVAQHEEKGNCHSSCSGPRFNCSAKTDEKFNENQISERLMSRVQVSGGIPENDPTICAPNHCQKAARKGTFDADSPAKSLSRYVVTPGTRQYTVVYQAPSGVSETLFLSGAKEPRRNGALYDSVTKSIDVTPSTMVGSATPSQNSRLPMVTPRESNDMCFGQNHAATTPGSHYRQLDNVTPTPSKSIIMEQTVESFSDAYERGVFTKIEDCFSLGLADCVMQVTSSNSRSLRFWKNSGLPCGFNQDLESSNDVEWIGAPRDFVVALCELRPGKTMGITERWVENHQRWIIWKLAATERRFAAYLCHSLTFSSVVRQLNLRYEKETLEGLRSPIRKMVNRDVSPASMMILCVATIIRLDPKSSDLAQSYRLELTDGWYSIRTEIDGALSSLVGRGQISTGTKLVVSNATLVGFQDGTDHLDEAFDVMDPDRSPQLSIRANGCRIARWNAKLGFVSPLRCQNRAGLLSVKKISDVLVDGGPIPQIEVSVFECEPVKYLESTQDGYKVWTEAEEAGRMEEIEKRRDKLVDQLRQEVEKECEVVSYGALKTIPI